MLHLLAHETGNPWAGVVAMGLGMAFILVFAWLNNKDWTCPRSMKLAARF